MKHGRRWLLVGTVVLLGAAAGFAGRNLTLRAETRAAAQAAPDAPGGPVVRKPAVPAVTVAVARTENFLDRQFVSGTLVARDEAMVGVQIDGLRIVELLAEDGDRVEKGQVLARLDRTQLDAMLAQNDAATARAEAAIAQAHSQIDQTEAMRNQASADLARARKLEPGILAASTLDQRIALARSTEAQFNAAQNALAVAEADRRSREAERRELMVRIGRTDVRAPVAGLISRRTARLGTLAMGTADPLFRIIADGAIDLEAEVPQDSLARLKLGMQALIDLPGGERPVTGTVRLISSEVDKTTRLGKVRLALPLDAPARIGSFASGWVEVERRNAVAVPAAAVTQAGAGDTIQVVREGRVEIRQVTCGVTNEGLIELRSGLAAGETVVLRAAAFLRNGDAVRPFDEPRSPVEASR